MDFDKLAKEVSALIDGKTEEAPAVPAAKQMSKEEFATYAKEQVEKARAEAKLGKSDESKQRLVALKAEVDKIAKFEFKANELPTVTVYKDPEQQETTEYEQSVQGEISTPDGKSNFTAKSAEFGKFLQQQIDALASNRPQDKKTREERAEQEFQARDQDDWPDDMAKCVRKSRREQDKDYDFGPDAR